MTSSLVGSEMCIRDRAQGSCGDMPANDEAEGAQEGVKTTEKLNPRTDPVSYTHLTLPTICSV
eukprot:8460460-Prorocentrum_lima.AAC.1